MLSDDELKLFGRIAAALERLADRWAPARSKEHKPATLGTAAYTEEERERLRLKDALKTKQPH